MKEKEVGCEFDEPRLDNAATKVLRTTELNNASPTRLLYPCHCHNEQKLKCIW